MIFPVRETIWPGILRFECRMLLADEIPLYRYPEAVPERLLIVQRLFVRDVGGVDETEAAQ